MELWLSFLLLGFLVPLIPALFAGAGTRKHARPFTVHPRRRRAPWEREETPEDW
jgi:hypothetical protein